MDGAIEWFEERARLETTLRYRFKNPALLETALTHRSAVHERGPAVASSYERLEFLGDALLGFFVSDWLYRDDPQAAEGPLSRRRQSVVRTATLAVAAERLGLAAAIRFGRGEERTGGRAKPSLLADVFEAVLGAVYLDGGIRSARAFAHRALRQALERTRGAAWTSGDHKTRLQEVIQAKLQRTPSYRIVSSTGPAHALRFLVEVRVGRRVLGRGTGTNRKRAEQEAARRALDLLNGDDA